MSDRKHCPEMSGAYKFINQSISNIKTTTYEMKNDLDIYWAASFGMLLLHLPFSLNPA
jgi:hypothetical protein